MNSWRLFIVLSFCLLFSFSMPKTEAQSGVGDRNLLLPGVTPEQAGQALEKILQNLADASQVELIRERRDPDQEFPENLTKVTIHMDINCNWDQMVRFLEAIRGYEKFLQVEELFIQSSRMQGQYRIHPILKVSGFLEHAPDDVRVQAQVPEKSVDAAETPLFRRDQNLEILRELTGLLPPGAVLTLYRNVDCAIQLRGSCPPSSTLDLIGKLENSPFLKDVTSTERLFIDAQTGQDLFMFSARCEK